MKLCFYGCGNEANFTFKNGKVCCSKNSSTCPIQREKNGALKKGKTPNWTNGNPRKGKKYGPAWNSGKTYTELMGVEKSAQHRDKIGKSVAKVATGKAKTLESEENRKKNISFSMKNNPLAGGYRKGSGRGKSGWYKGFWSDSSYELVFIIYCLDHNIGFTRNTVLYPYEYMGIIKHWIPDFIMSDQTYIEIKGYETEQTIAKYASFPYELKILKKIELKPMFDYVESNYGKNFISLYEKE